MEQQIACREPELFPDQKEFRTVANFLPFCSYLRHQYRCVIFASLQFVGLTQSPRRFSFLLTSVMCCRTSRLKTRAAPATQPTAGTIVQQRTRSNHISDLTSCRRWRGAMGLFCDSRLVSLCYRACGLGNRNTSKTNASIRLLEPQPTNPTQSLRSPALQFAFPVD